MQLQKDKQACADLIINIEEEEQERKPGEGKDFVLAEEEKVWRHYGKIVSLCSPLT